MTGPQYTFDELKKMAKSFLDKLPDASVESIEQGWKMFCIAYLNMEGTEAEHESAAPALYRLIHREYDKAMIK